MPYTPIYNTTFPGSDTSVGSGADSTTGVPGMIDHIGNVYRVVNHLATNTVGSNPPLDCLYRHAGAGDLYQDGRVRIFANTADVNNIALVARFNPTAATETGYALMVFSVNQIFVYKCVGGSSTAVVAGASLASGAIPTTGDVCYELICVDVNATTQLTLNVYAASAVVTEEGGGAAAPVLATYSYTDSIAPIQSAGAWGHAAYGGGAFYRLQTASLIPAALSAGTLATANVYNKSLDVSFATAPSGGTGSKTIQFQRRTGTSGAFTNVGSAGTGTSFHDTGRTAATTYQYQAIVTDTAAATATTPIITVTTATKTLAAIGDSITFGLGGAPTSALTQAGLDLAAAGHPTALLNLGRSGSETADWQPGGSYMIAALAAIAESGATQSQISLGVNDSRTASAVSASVYKTRLQNIIGALLGGGIEQIVLHYPTYVVPGALGVFDANSDTLLQSYQPQIDSLINGTTILQGDKLAFVRFQTQVSPYTLGDGVHPSGEGHVALGHLWGTALINALYVIVLTSLTVSIAAPGSDGTRPISITPTPTEASLAGSVIQEIGPGSLVQTSNSTALLTPPASTPDAQAGIVKVTVGGIEGLAVYIVQSSLPPFDPDLVYQWNITGQAVTQIKGSTEQHRIDISAEKRNGGYLTGVDIAAAGLEICFLEDASDLDNDPASDDAPVWYPLDVDTSGASGTPSRVFAYIEVGPQAVPEIAKADTYQRYVRVSASPLVIKKVQPLTVTAE